MANRPVSKLPEVNQITDDDLFLLSDMTPNPKTSNKVSWKTIKGYFPKPYVHPTWREVVINIFPILYPVGSIWITVNNTLPDAVKNIGTWVRINSGYFIQQAAYSGSNNSSSLGGIIKQGLPNITGKIVNDATKDSEAITNADCMTYSGAIWMGNAGHTHHYVRADAPGGGYDSINFNASKSNKIYGNSSNVQPNAVQVNIFRRTS